MESRILFLALLCAPAWGQISPVSCTALTVGGSGTMTFAFTGATVGQTFVVEGALEDEQTITLADNHSLFTSTSPVVSQQASYSGYLSTVSLWVAQIVVAGDYTFTLTAPGSAHLYGGVCEAPNVAGVDVFNSTSANVQSLALTTTHANELLFGLYASQLSTTAGTGFTSAGTVAYDYHFSSEYSTTPPSNSAGVNNVAFTTAGFTVGFVGLGLYPSTVGPPVSVTVTGITAMQAALSYTAPNSSACSVAISTSATYSPLVPDVNGTLFTGANLDSRVGGVSIGLARMFVAGTRTVQVSGGSNYSRALQAATQYYYQVTCGSSTGAGEFMTQTIPVGLGAGDPIPINPANDGTYLYPTFSATDRTSSAVDPHTGALVKNMTLPGDLTGGITASMGPGTGGIGVLCHPTPVLASDEAKYGYHCQVFLGGADPALFWIASDGETRFLGVMRTSYADWSGYANTTACMGSLSAPFDNTDPNTWYCILRPTANAPVVAKAVYTGHGTPGNDADLTGQDPTPIGGTPHTTFTLVEPFARDLVTLLTEFDPKYASVGAACCNAFNAGDWANGKYWFYLWTTQDRLGWVAGFDPNQTPAQQLTQFGSKAGCIDNPAVTGSTYTGQPGCVVASTGSFTGGAGSALRWATLHTLIVTPASTWVSISMNAPRMKGGPYYSVTLTSALTTGSSTCTMSQPGGNTVPNWPDSSWTPGCSTITVVGDPALVGTVGYPATIPALPGDLISVNSGDYIHSEVMRLLDKGSGNSWYVQRQYYYHISCSWSNSSVAIGGTLDMLSPAVEPDCNLTGMQVWWDTINGALNSNGTTVLREPISTGHPAYINNATYGRWTYVAEQAVFGSEPGRLISPPTPLTMNNLPPFNGIAAAALEDHSSLSVTDPPDLGTYQQIVDGRPYYGDVNTVTSAIVSLVSGQLYRIRGSTIADNYKLTPYFANSGSRAMKEVSGVMLATDSSTQFQWCAALFAGECYGGSLAGDVYFNAPSVANAYCTYNWSTLQTTTTIPNDICISPASAVTQSLEMQEITSDPTGAQVRVISNSLSKYDQELVFWNARTIPDGSWLFSTVAGEPNSLKLFKIPPRPLATTIPGALYYSYPVTVPATVGTVKVEFGYAENGNPATSLNCTARIEPCVAVASTVGTPPFWFETSESGSYTGASCTSGCTISIPAMAGRTMYYRTVVAGAPGPMQVVALGASLVSTLRPIFGPTILGSGVIR